MRELALQDFSRGIDRTRPVEVPEPGQLFDLKNCYISPGKKITRRHGFRRVQSLANAFGLIAHGGKLHTFYGATDPGSNALVDSHQVTAADGSGAEVDKIHFAQSLLGYFYVVAEHVGGLVKHYYLDADLVSAWSASSTYQIGDVVRPSTPNGLRYEVTAETAFSTWQAKKQYQVGDKVVPTEDTGFYYEVTALKNDTDADGKVSSGEFEPDWPTTAGATVEEVGGENRIANRAAGGVAELGEILEFLNGKYGRVGGIITGNRLGRMGFDDIDITGSTPGSQIFDGELSVYEVVPFGLEWTCKRFNSDTEPTWPTTIGATLTDLETTWTARVDEVLDDNCPQTREATIAANKIWAIDNDVVRFSSTSRPRNWSAAEDAGFLPTGLKTQSDPDLRTLDVYRGTLSVWTDSAMQLWQIDPDPANHTFIDVIEGAGTAYSRGTTALVNDLLYLSGEGIRSMRITSSTGNVESDDVGSVIDPLVKAALAGKSDFDPLSLYFPNTGQYWCFVGTEVFVFSMHRTSGIYAWSRWELPWSVQYATTLAGVAYVLASDGYLYQYDETSYQDEDGTGNVLFTTLIDWPYLSMGDAGLLKQVMGADVVATHSCDLTFGYDPGNTALRTTALTVGPDTRPGGLVQVEVGCTSIAPRITHTANEAFELYGLSVYYDTLGLAA